MEKTECSELVSDCKLVCKMMDGLNLLLYTTSSVWSHFWVCIQHQRDIVLYYMLQINNDLIFFFLL